MNAETPEQEARLIRKLFILPGDVTLATEGPRRWATDGFVMVEVTETHLGKLSDGTYRIVASKGYLAKEGLTLDAELALDTFARDTWESVEFTGWSVYDHPAKLCVLRSAHGFPLAVNEELWRSYHATFPDCKWQVAYPTEDRTRFRVIDFNTDQLCAYVSGVKLEGRHFMEARAICGNLNGRTSRRSR